jgi:hypothetical protein
MLIPTRKQYQKWSIPAKWSFIGGVLAVVGLLFSFYSGCWSKEESNTKYSALERFADVELITILEGSNLCCDIKTTEAVFFMPEEGKLLLKADTLIWLIPDTVNSSELLFSFSIDPNDSIKSLDCNMVGITEVDIYFFRNSKIFCSKPAIIDFRDPSEFCSALKR